MKKSIIINKYSVSIVIPVRNEEGNLRSLLKRIPFIGTKSEIIFVEGHSIDRTWDLLLTLIKNKNKYRIKAVKQKGNGKSDAVRCGILQAKGEIIIIFDGDLCVVPEKLVDIYNRLVNNRNIFVNCSRFIYPLEKDSMGLLNYFGNMILSYLLSYFLDQKISDTLCGVKAFWLKDYLHFYPLVSKYQKSDPFGDYLLLFGAYKTGLQICEIPINYKKRTYGKSNINIFTNGFKLLCVVKEAFWEFKIKKFFSLH